ncbi:hypothetical protein ACVWWO_003181 [Bradyrhizobium sp. F1.13.1]
MSEAALLWLGSPRELSKQRQWNGFSVAYHLSAPQFHWSHPSS